MEAKCFFSVFNILYVNLHEQLNISTKEDFYRCIFSENYALVNAGTDADGLRKITSGHSTILQYVMKKLHTIIGFELLRTSVENNIISHYEDTLITEDMLDICEKNTYIPQNVKSQLREASHHESNYELSRFIAAVLVCANYADYITIQKEKGKDKPFIDISFMRLGESKPISKSPEFITDSMDASVDEVFGRNDDLKRLYQDLIVENRKIMISAVGGLGKTELVKAFLNQLRATTVEECGIEQIAWIPYDNNDICLSLKQSLHLECSADEVWGKIQDLTERGRERLLMVIDNIETIDNDPYLKKLSELPCRLLVTSRVRALYGFKNVLFLQPLEMEYCRELFYKHYQFKDRDNEILNDIIDLTAKLTIMIVFIAKAAYLEGLSLREVYDNLVEKGFKLSEEDVSCEHEKMQNDETIIAQMCILFSLVKYDETDKQILTCISTIPNLQFDFPKAKRWFSIKKNAHLMRLYGMGMLEHVTSNRSHIYWMHSVIAAAVREQQKDKLYELARPFVQILNEELEPSLVSGKAYEKEYLIPFTWSIADIMQNHWRDEEDTDFLTSIFHLCYDCSNYRLSENILNLIIGIKNNPQNGFSVIDLAYTYRDKVDVLQQLERHSDAKKLLNYIEKLFDENVVPENERDILKVQYAIFYQMTGKYKKSKEYFEKIIREQEVDKERYDKYDAAMMYANLGRLLTESGEYEEARQILKKAIEIYGAEEIDTNLTIIFSNLASAETELINAGHKDVVIEETENLFKKVVRFREKHLNKKHADLAVSYHEYANFLYITENYSKALKYNIKAYDIYNRLYGEYSIDGLRNLNLKALIFSNSGHLDDALLLYDKIFEAMKHMKEAYYMDLANFKFNYGRCLLQDDKFEDAKEPLMECITIWKEKSQGYSRSYAEANQFYSYVLFQEGDFEKALEYLIVAKDSVIDDKYLQADILDGMGFCYLILEDMENSVDCFVDTIKILTELQAYDYDTKFETCENIAAVLESEEEEETLCKEQIMDRLSEDDDAMDYVNTFFTKVDEK